MRFPDLQLSRVPRLQQIRRAEDLENIEFVDGIAEVEVPIELLDLVPLKHQERLDSPRLAAVLHSIRSKGYSSLEPIVCRIGAKGRWIVVDGGHRITAAKRVSREFFSNLWGNKVGDLTFVLFQTPMSYSKLRKRKMLQAIGPETPAEGTPDSRADSRAEGTDSSDDPAGA